MFTVIGSENGKTIPRYCAVVALRQTFFQPSQFQPLAMRVCTVPGSPRRAPFTGKIVSRQGTMCYEMLWRKLWKVSLVCVIMCHTSFLYDLVASLLIDGTVSWLAKITGLIYFINLHNWIFLRLGIYSQQTGTLGIPNHALLYRYIIYVHILKCFYSTRNVLSWLV
jgi:hypothetical protein